jgi:hypothetical protein
MISFILLNTLTRHETQLKTQRFINMGTPQKINIQAYANTTGVFETRPLRKGSLIKATNLLNMNHDNYHIYIHNLGLHSMRVDTTEDIK